MRMGYGHWSRTSVKTLSLLAVTLLAWATTASLFIVLKVAPEMRGAPVTISYSSTLCSLLPWLAGLIFWIRVGKRAKSGEADGDVAGFCYSIIVLTVGAAYVAIACTVPLLLWAMTNR